jgi:hypothetical protein
MIYCWRRSDNSRRLGARLVSPLANIDTTVAPGSDAFKFAAAHTGTTSWSVSANGGTVATGTTTSTAPTTLQIGRFGTTTQFNGVIRRILYIPRRLSNAELQALTA